MQVNDIWHRLVYSMAYIWYYTQSYFGSLQNIYCCKHTVQFSILYAFASGSGLQESGNLDETENEIVRSV